VEIRVFFPALPDEILKVPRANLRVEVLEEIGDAIARKLDFLRRKYLAKRLFRRLIDEAGRLSGMRTSKAITRSCSKTQRADEKIWSRYWGPSLWR
jgi:hypothetical protein